MQLKTVTTDTLTIGYYDSGPPTSFSILILSHGFPYDIQAYSSITPQLVKAGFWVITPYLRGYGSTTFISPSTPRSGQQSALASDIIRLMDALNIQTAILGGFDWGGLASTVCAILYPHRVTALVSLACYDVIHRPSQLRPAPALVECAIWYAHLFQTERGKALLQNRESRAELCRLLWNQWSPGHTFQTGLFEGMMECTDNPDWVDVVINAYRWVHGQIKGDPEYDHLEEILERRPTVHCPTITFDGSLDPLKPGGTDSEANRSRFVGRYEHRTLDIGHALPYEAPHEFVEAIKTVHEWSQE